MKGAKGVKMPRGDIDSMKAYPAFYPTKPEQQKIAECLSSVDELIAAQARKLDALKTHKKGLMQQLFPTDGETQPRLRFPEFQNAGEWKEKVFGELLDGIIDFRGRTPLKLGMEWGRGNITSLSANNVKNGFIDYAAECNLGSEELYQRWMGGVNLEKDDIVFTMEAPLGKALLLPDSQKYILSQRVVAFKTNAEVRNPFLVQLIWSDGFQNGINEVATGSTAKGINQKALKTIPVKLPHPNEQQRIADCLTSLDNLITAQTQKLAALKTHKKGLMQQLFPSPEAVEA
jgi:type I restriction enzyme S subunit